MKVKFVPQNVEFDIKPGQSVMHVAQDHGLYIKSVCKGVPSCAECRVRVIDGDHNVLPPGSEELSLIGTGHFIDHRRLSCQLKCFGDISVDMTEQIAKQNGLMGGRKSKNKSTKDDRVEDAHAIRVSDSPRGRGGDSGSDSSDVDEQVADQAAKPVEAPRAPRPARAGQSPRPQGSGPRPGAGSGPRSGPREVSVQNTSEESGPSGADSSPRSRPPGPPAGGGKPNRGARPDNRGQAPRSQAAGPRPPAAGGGSPNAGAEATAGESGNPARRKRRRGGRGSKGPSGGGSGSGPSTPNQN